MFSHRCYGHKGFVPFLAPAVGLEKFQSLSFYGPDFPLAQSDQNFSSLRQEIISYFFVFGAGSLPSTINIHNNNYEALITDYSSMVALNWLRGGFTLEEGWRFLWGGGSLSAHFSQARWALKRRALSCLF